jgi:hypothetical protein
MKIEEIRRAKNHRPSQAVRIRTADGHEIPIHHPDAVARDDRDNPRVLPALWGNERYWVEVALINGIGEAAPNPPPDSNGSARPCPAQRRNHRPSFQGGSRGT